ncbi:helix-turn-helix transcriptional regulator [uncultured Slackia sp.]|uniref:helix-turn-helix domain-containing protein n=1 Tax=uncultured Slackia sp. TaxID=665903 RepID=UPI0026DFF9FE|nr:helix-turn-helix transcriptional regulator [uncultured Slackia sp.]
MTIVVMFYYTLMILLVSIVAAAFCLSGYLVSHRRFLIFAGVGFLSYFLDVALVFQDDFLLRGSSEPLDSIYFVGSQLPSVITGAGLVTAFWLCLCDFFEVKNKVLLVAPTAVFVVGSVTLYFTVGSGPMGLFLFYGMRSLVMVWMLLYVAMRYIGSTDGVVRERLWRHRFFYAGLWVLVVCIVAENAVFMFVIDPQLVESGSVPFFPERNFAENALMIWCAAFVCVGCWRLFALHFKTPPAENCDKAVAFIDNGLASYCDRYGLSAREEEVLKEVLLGKDNQCIATEMSLALSTVKVHVHNILHKTGQANRQDLMRDFRMHS